MDDANKPEIDLVAEDLDDSVVAEENANDLIKKLKEKVKASEAKAREYLDGWQRTQAEFANLRKKDEEAKLEFLRYANQSLIEELIPVLDSFNIAITSGHREIEPIYRQVLSVLRARGLEELMPIGNLFNPSAHEAISVEGVDKIEDDQKIIDVLQKGYKLGDKIIRPAKVKIGEFNS